MSSSTAPTPFTQALAITSLSLLLGFLFDYFFFGKIPGLSFPVYVAAIILGLVVLSRLLHRPLPGPVYGLLLPLAFFSAMVAVRTSPLLTFLNVVASLTLLLLIVTLTLGGRLTHFRIAQYLAVPFLPLKFLSPLLRTLSELVAVRTTYKDQPVLTQVLKGIALTLPVLVIFLLLFSSADLIVGRYVSSLFSFQVGPENIARAVLITLATLGLAGAYSFIFGPRPAEPAATPAAHGRVIGAVESNILFGSVNVLFFLFILVQLAYLFGGQGNISAQGFTYAEYARKGFFELLAVALLSFGLLWAADRYVAKGEQHHTPAFRLLSTALILQVILIMASAFKRLYLYEQAYGFTTLRLFSHAFTVLLAIIFVLLAAKILRGARESFFAFPAFLTVILFLVVMNLLNPDAFIARQNLDRYQATGKLDAPYLAHLSSDALPAVLAALGTLKAPDQQALASELSDHQLSRAVADTEHWQSWNLSRVRAQPLLDAKAADIDRLRH